MTGTGEANRRLGRGLDALLGVYGPAAAEPAGDAGGRRMVPLALIHTNPRNPRRDFDAAELDELAASVKTHGLVQPIVWHPIVAAGGDNWYLMIPVTGPVTAWVSAVLGIGVVLLGLTIAPWSVRAYASLAASVLGPSRRTALITLRGWCRFAWATARIARSFAASSAAGRARRR